MAIKDTQLNRKSGLILSLLVAILALVPIHNASATCGGFTLTAPTDSRAVTIDGVLQPSEWSAPTTHVSQAWTYNNSTSLIGGLNGGLDIWTKTNGTDLLIALGATGGTKANSGLDTYNYTLSLLFDNNNDGVIENNENAKSLGITYTASGNTTTYRDLHYDSTKGSYVDNTQATGAAALSHTSNSWSWEFAVPLTSSSPQDFTLAQNASIGFNIVYSEQHYYNGALVGSGWAYWQVSYPNGYPTGAAPSANGWAQIIWTNLSSPVSDCTPPTIATPTITPSSPGSSDTVKVSVNVTDDTSVKNVSITYTTDNWKSVNKTITASYNGTTHIATAQIPPLQFGGHVEYYVTAFDSVDLKTVNNNSGNYFSYDVGPPWFANFWIYIILGLGIAVILFAVFYSRRRSHQPSTKPAT